MSDPNKKDEPPEKKSFSGKLVAFSIIILALLIFFAVSSVILPEMVNQAAQVTGNTGASLHRLARGADSLASGGSDAFGALVKIVIAVAVVFLVGRAIIVAIKESGAKKDDQ